MSDVIPMTTSGADSPHPEHGRETPLAPGASDIRAVTWETVEPARKHYVILQAKG